VTSSNSPLHRRQSVSMMRKQPVMRATSDKGKTAEVQRQGLVCCVDSTTKGCCGYVRTAEGMARVLKRCVMRRVSERGGNKDGCGQHAYVVVNSASRQNCQHQGGVASRLTGPPVSSSIKSVQQWRRRSASPPLWPRFYTKAEERLALPKVRERD
jgi:hypothetical protein